MLLRKNKLNCIQFCALWKYLQCFFVENKMDFKYISLFIYVGSSVLSCCSSSLIPVSTSIGALLHSRTRTLSWIAKCVMWKYRPRSQNCTNNHTGSVKVWYRYVRSELKKIPVQNPGRQRRGKWYAKSYFEIVDVDTCRRERMIRRHVSTIGLQA